MSRELASKQGGRPNGQGIDDADGAQRAENICTGMIASANIANSRHQRWRNALAVSETQEKEVQAFVGQHCLDEEYHGSCRSAFPPYRLFMIFFDFHQTGLVIDPNSGLPLLVTERECDELPSVEMISTTARTMYLMNLPDTERTKLGKFFLLRTDVMISIGDLGLA